MSESNVYRVQPASQTVAKAPVLKVEMDDRCMLFPDGKTLQHVLITTEGAALTMEGIFAFNASCLDPQIVALPLADAREFARELVGVVYQAKTGFYLTDEWKIAINVMANGYQIDIQSAARKAELFLSTGVIWRFIKALLMALDTAAPVRAN